MAQFPAELQRPPIRRRLRALKKLLGATTPAPIELQILGRMLLHSALVGAAAGLLGSLFFAGVEATQRIGLESLTGYLPLRAAGEGILGESPKVTAFRPWLLLICPALGALLAGVISTWLAPETLGGGSDAIIQAFHQNRGIVRKRVPFVKAVVSIFTLATGGSAVARGRRCRWGARSARW